jgi:hypothetical protein
VVEKKRKIKGKGKEREKGKKKEKESSNNQGRNLVSQKHILIGLFDNSLY